MRINPTNFTIYKDCTILEALKKLNNILYENKVSRLILFVIDNDGKVLGSLTDGDIRRSLVETANLHSTVDTICNRNFVFDTKKDEYINLHQFRKRGVSILPLLNEKGKLVDIIDLELAKAVLPLECMIMAGGRGKRLSPLTDNIPKPMLPLGGKPIIEHNIDRLIEFGITKIYISVKYLGEKIEEYFGDGSRKGISIEYIREKDPLGTAGALSLVPKFNTKYILLINSDLFTNADFEDLYLDMLSHKADIAIASTEYKIDIPYAVFETINKRVITFKEKPSYIYHSNAGIYLLKNSLIEKIPKNFYFDITDLMELTLKEEGVIIHNPIMGYWIDIGNPSDYKHAQEFVKHQK